MGWAGLSMVCYGVPLQAAQASCAGTTGCQGVTGEPSDGPGGSLAFPIATATGTAALYVQPCERLEADFFNSLFPAVIVASVAIVCARVIWRQFGNHTHT